MEGTLEGADEATHKGTVKRRQPVKGIKEPARFPVKGSIIHGSFQDPLRVQVSWGLANPKRNLTNQGSNLYLFKAPLQRP